MGWRLIAALALIVGLATAPLAAGKDKAVGTSFPPGFPTVVDASLATPVLGFGSSDGPVAHTPVIFLHGNNDTPFPTACNPFYGHVSNVAQYFLEHGYRASELWGLGYQGDQCDLIATPTNRSGVAHSTAANVADLRAFVHAVLEYTGAGRVDIVAHSLGGTLAREWMRQDQAHGLVRRLVSIASPNHGIVNCSPSPANYWQLPALGGFAPASAICQEYGSDQTPFLTTLNAGDETPGPTRYLTISNADTDFVYISALDGVLAGVPAQDLNGNAHDFSASPRLADAENVLVTGQGAFDPLLGTGHLGILSSPETWRTAWQFLRSAN
ncbi:MAG: alpha/beta fold hydrolase [Actinobacteria bacterium]|nr:alpha/beta fold hydrolase [Actinomycetota bacterium]